MYNYNLKDTGWRLTETSKVVRFGDEGKGHVEAIATWTNGYSKISAIENDHEVVFISESKSRNYEKDDGMMQWIPPEIIISLASLLTTR